MSVNYGVAYVAPPSDLLPTGPVAKTRRSANDAMIESTTGVLDQFSVGRPSRTTPVALALTGAALMTAPRNVEDAVVRITQKVRAAGIHLVERGGAP